MYYRCYSSTLLLLQALDHSKNSSKATSASSPTGHHRRNCSTWIARSIVCRLRWKVSERPLLVDVVQVLSWEDTASLKVAGLRSFLSIATYPSLAFWKWLLSGGNTSQNPFFWDFPVASFLFVHPPSELKANRSPTSVIQSIQLTFKWTGCGGQMKSTRSTVTWVVVCIS